MREKDSVAAYFVQAMIHGLGDDQQRLAAAARHVAVSLAAAALGWQRCRQWRQVAGLAVV